MNPVPNQQIVRTATSPSGLNRSNSSEGEFGDSFYDIKIRHAFIRKVYLILLCQLLVTTSFVALCIFSEPVKIFVNTHVWLYHVSYTLFIVLYFVLVCPCCGSISRTWPANIIILAIFTAALSFMVGIITTRYEMTTVIYALVATALVVFILTLFACQTQYDFTSCGSMMCMFSMMFMIFAMVCMVYFMVAGPSKILYLIYCCLGALLFSLFIVYDTQLIVGGKGRANQLSAEDYIIGAVMLYLDIVNLFLFILGIMKEDQ